MKRFILLSFGLCVTLSIPIFAAVFYGRTQIEVNELASLGFDLCNGKPCFLGITPGITKISEAKSILTGRGTITNNGAKFQQIDINKRAVVISASDEIGDTTDHIVGYLNKSPIAARAVLERYGSPCSVSVVPAQCNTYLGCSGWGSIQLYYEAIVATIDISNLNPSWDYITPESPVEQLELFDPVKYRIPSKVCHIYYNINGSVDTDWLGFAPIKRYLSKKTPDMN